MSDTYQNTYSMRVVTRMTGLTADAIRAWERRYGAVVPERSEGGTRRYSLADVRRLSRLRTLTERGFGIKEIANLDEALDTLLAQSENSPTKAGTNEEVLSEQRFFARYLGALEAFDVRGAYRLLARAAAILEAREFIFKYVVPLAHQVGERWERGTFGVAQEHLFSQHIRNLLTGFQLELDSTPGARLVVVSTPPGHRHEFGALIGTLLASAHGFRTLYLGPDLPWSELETAARRTKADLYLLSVIRIMSTDEQKSLCNDLQRLQEKLPVWIGLPESMASAVPATVVPFHRFEDYSAALAAF